MNKAIVVLVVLSILPLTLYSAQPTLVLLSNSIDYARAQDFITYLQDRGFEIKRIDAGEFQQYREEKFIIILGGPDAPEGVGSVVQEILGEEEQSYLRTSGNKAMYVKSKWVGDQRIFVIAGSDRTKTAEAHAFYREQLYKALVLPEEPAPSPPIQIPDQSTTIYAGEYTEGISYWGYKKTDNYVTVRLQTRSDYPLVYFTFKDLPATIRIGGVEYDVYYYDDQKIIIKRR